MSRDSEEERLVTFNLFEAIGYSGDADGSNRSVLRVDSLVIIIAIIIYI